MRLIVYVLIIWALIVLSSCSLELRHQGEVVHKVEIDVLLDYFNLKCAEDLGVDLPQNYTSVPVSVQECAEDMYLEFFDFIGVESDEEAAITVTE